MNEITFNDEIAKSFGVDGYYATQSGKIISVKVKGGQGSFNYNKPRILKEKTDKDGYKEVCLSLVEDGVHKRLYRRVHRLVWIAFNGDIPDSLTIDHINSICSDNRLCNLQLMTREMNTSKSAKGKVTWQKGRKHTSRLMFETYINGAYVGTYDKKELQEIYGLSRHDVDNYNKYTKNKIIKGIKLEKV